MLATANQQKTLLANDPTTTSETLKSAERKKSNKPREIAKPREVDLLASVFTQIMRKDLPEHGVIVRYAKSKIKPNVLIAEFSGVLPCQNCKDIFPAEVLTNEFCPTCYPAQARQSEA